MKLKSETKLRETARRALAKLEPVRTKSRNPFSGIGPIAGLSRKRKAVRAEKKGDELLHLNPSAAEKMYESASAVEKNPLFGAILNLKRARATLLDVAMGENDIGEAAWKLYSSYALLSLASRKFQTGGLPASISYAAGSIAHELGNGVLARDGFRYARIHTRNRVLGAVYREAIGDSHFADGQFEDASDAYSAALQVLGDSGVPLKAAIYAKLARCYFQTNIDSAEDALVKSERNEWSAEDEVAARKELKAGNYQSAVSFLDNALRNEVGGPYVKSILALEYSSLLIACAREIRSEHEGGAPEAGSKDARDIVLLRKQAASFMKTAASSLGKIYPAGSIELMERAWAVWGPASTGEF
jgi:tetratricopeptide (TPR) repeat protein